MLLSHPDKELKDHLTNTANNSIQILNNLKLSFNVGPDAITHISIIIALTHDIGKSTSFFQRYIVADESKKAELKQKAETNHSLLSSLFTYNCVKKHIAENYLEYHELTDYFPIISYIVVKRHHGNIHDLTSEFSSINKNIINRQLDSIDQKEFDTLLKNLKLLFPKLDINLTNFKANIPEIISDLEKQPVFGVASKIGNNKDTVLFILSQLFYSVLLESDKRDVVLDEDVKRSDLSSSLIDEYKKIKFTAPEGIDNARNDIYIEAIEHLKSIYLENDKIFSLTVPTGTGKTLTSISFALKLRERIMEELGFKPKIIYSLPFLSIIDQNADELAKTFKTVYGNEPSTDKLLKHHHLAEISYKKENDFEAYDRKESLFLIEGWNSEIVVTTFMQLFYSVISNKNRMLRKFHSICNSIIILDEVQTIPHQYWLLTEKIFSALCNYCNCYIIFVTATQPLIFEKTFSLVDSKKYFEMFNRLELSIDTKNEIKLSDFIEKAREAIQQYEDKSIMFVMNTIRSSLELYKALKQVKCDDEFFYLSSNIIPKKRLETIKKVKSCAKRRIIVTTQVIEAGVDIDVDVIYRDLAPLDSINQVCGRCNRNNRNNKGLVRVFKIIEDKCNKSFCSYIYDGFLIDRLYDVVDDRKDIQEKDFYAMISEYFRILKDKKSDDTSRKLLGYVFSLDYSKLEEFKLIEKLPEVDVFVNTNEKSEELWQKYLALKFLDPIKRKIGFLEFKKEFNEYLISIRIGTLQKVGLPTDKEIIQIGDQYYDEETGFKIDMSGDDCIFI